MKSGRNIREYSIRRKVALLFFLVFAVTIIQAQNSGSLYFNGIDNFVEIKNRPLNNIGSGDFTIEAWINGVEQDGISHPMILSNRGEDPFGGGVFLSIHEKWGDSESEMLNFQINSTNYFIINNGSFTGNLLDGTCHHVAVSRRDNILIYYIDGNKIGTRMIMGSASVNFNGPLLIGKDKPTNNTFNGFISQCRIWNLTRSHEEIENSKDVSLEGNETGLIGYWELNDGTGQIVSDKTNMYPGILGGDFSENKKDPYWSEEACISMPTSTLNPTENSKFSIYPNPTSDFIIVENSTNEELEISLYNEVGKLVLTRRGLNESIDVSDYNKGVYYIRVHYKNNSIIERFLKI